MKSSTNPKISVIIPVFNREKYIVEALESVLNQTRLPDELIVVDDGSTDRSGEIVQSFGDRIRYYRQPNSGAAVARNFGVNLATGQFLAFLDSDDRWHPEKLAQQLTAFEMNPQLAVVFGHVRQFYSPDLPVEHRPRLTAEVMPGYHIGTMLARQEVFQQVGPFDPTLQVGDFVSWHAKASDLKLPMTMLSHIVMGRRIHSTNMGRTQRAQATRDYLKIVRASLKRRQVQAETL